MRIHPQRDLCLVVLEDPAGYSPIIIPEAHREPPDRARVLAVGPKVPEQVRPGMYVILSKYVGETVNSVYVEGHRHTDATCKLVPVEGILAVVEGIEQTSPFPRS